MTSEVLINVGAGEIRIALMVDGRLEDYSFERVLGGGTGHIGDVMLGRVRRVVPGMQAAFVDVGLPRLGFLALSEARLLAKSKSADISDCVREGEAILVQVIKDPIGEKGARLSTGIALPGRFLVMTPGRPGLAVSRRIANGARRAALTTLGEELLNGPTPDAGFIFRTAAADASREELTLDAKRLDTLWRDIEAKRKMARPPAMLHRDIGPIERALRDRVRDVARVLIDDAAAAQAARDYCRQTLSGSEAKIEYRNEALFDCQDLEDEIARLSQPRVPLSCGGWITIEATEALTAIDINSGSHADAGGPEETGMAVNLEAARAIGRQIRLRGIGGLIVVDFIQMTRTANRERVLAALADSLAFDRVPVDIHAIWECGIVAIARKRAREALVQQSNQPCAACAGSGHTPTAETLAQDVLRQVEREARAWPGRELVVTAAPAVTAWLVAHGAAEALARRGASRVRFEAGTGQGFNVRPA